MIDWNYMRTPKSLKHSRGIKLIAMIFIKSHESLFEDNGKPFGLEIYSDLLEEDNTATTKKCSRHIIYEEIFNNVSDAKIKAERIINNPAIFIFS